MLSLEDFRYVVPDEVLATIYAKARGLYDKHIVHVNSTYMGGGVAEMLGSLIPLLNDVGVYTGWRILHGNPDFFNITKKFHNALQGNGLNLSNRKKQLYTATNEHFSVFTHLDHDCIIVHDPQPLSLIMHYTKRQPWIWRCHIDLTHPNPKLYDFLKGFLLKYDQIVISSERYIKDDLPVDQRIMYPAISPLSLKNIDLAEKTIDKYVKKARIPRDKPVITQVSRLDPWKDPYGVLEVYKRVKEKVDCRLVFCYNLATDDPEGVEVYTKLQRKAKKLMESGDVIFVLGNNDILVNSIQSFSDVIIQKSTREGFCLAVTEALWKAKPVVASNVGGIPAQIEDDKSGFLLEPGDLDGFAERIIYLLKNPDTAEKLGKAAKETVREKFLITRLLSDHLDMYNAVINSG